MANGIDAEAAATPHTAIPTAKFFCRTVVKRVLISANLSDVPGTRYNTSCTTIAATIINIWGLYMARRLSSSPVHFFAACHVAVGLVCSKHGTSIRPATCSTSVSNRGLGVVVEWCCQGICCWRTTANRSADKAWSNNVHDTCGGATNELQRRCSCFIRGRPTGARRGEHLVAYYGM